MTASLGAPSVPCTPQFAARNDGTATVSWLGDTGAGRYIGPRFPERCESEPGSTAAQRVVLCRGPRSSINGFREGLRGFGWQ